MQATDLLTTRQHETLDALRALVAAHGHAPTVRELADELGLASPSSALERLRQLEELGVISRGGGQARVLRFAPEQQWGQRVRA